MTTPLEASLGRYRIDGELGRGGMGVVHRAEDTVLGRPVALKLLSTRLSHDAEFRDRFSREAALLARLDSPHVVQIYDFGQQDETLYMVTQLIDGGDLSRLLAESGSLEPAEAIGVVLQVCEGLASAHEVGVIHRDVKPSNVLVRRRGGRLTPYLCDFGIAATADAEHTRAGMVVGSPAYMAPERHDGARPDVSGDIYSLGCLLFALLIGNPPFQGTPTQVMRAHLLSPPPRLTGTPPLADGLNAVLATALAKEPGHRYASAGALAAALDAIMVPPGATVAVSEAVDDTIVTEPTVVSPWAAEVTMFGERTLLTLPAGATAETNAPRPSFSADDVAAIEGELATATARTGVAFSVYIGQSEPPAYRYAQRLHGTLGNPVRSVLFMIDPFTRVFHLVTGSELRTALTDRFVRTVADGMQAQFRRGAMREGLVDGVHTIARRLGQPPGPGGSLSPSTGVEPAATLGATADLDGGGPACGSAPSAVGS